MLLPLVALQTRIEHIGNKFGFDPFGWPVKVLCCILSYFNKIQASFYQFLHHFASSISKSGVPALQAQLYVQFKEHFQDPGMLLCDVFFKT